MHHAHPRLRAAAPASAVLALALLSAACGGGSAEIDAADSSPGEAASSDAATHDHGDVIDVVDGMAVPAISLEVVPDPVSGVNLFVDLDNFEIAPRSASTDPVDGQGHLHLYLDGERQLRFYNRALHLADLPTGEHEIAVEVSANNHSPYAIDGTPIVATRTVTVEPADHDHGQVEVYEVDRAAAPTLALEVFPDPKSGWNLFAETDLTFAPEASGSDPVDGEGHLHLYVDGERQHRLYGPWWHLPSLPEGEHEIVVEAATNDHAAYAVGGQPVRASAMITVTAEQAAGHDDHGGMGDDGALGDDHGAMANDDHGATTGGAELEDAVTIDVAITGDAVEVASSRIDVPLGSTVAIVVEADRADHVHVHGYDHLVDTIAGEPAEVVFVADVPGVFEVELEDAGLFLFELAVEP